MKRVTLRIEGMSCGHCVSQVAKALNAVDGVRVEQVTIGSATVAFDPGSTGEERIRRVIEDQGYMVASTTG